MKPSAEAVGPGTSHASWTQHGLIGRQKAWVIALDFALVRRTMIEVMLRVETELVWKGVVAYMVPQQDLDPLEGNQLERNQGIE